MDSILTTMEMDMEMDYNNESYWLEEPEEFVDLNNTLSPYNNNNSFNTITTTTTTTGTSEQILLESQPPHSPTLYNNLIENDLEIKELLLLRNQNFGDGNELDLDLDWCTTSGTSNDDEFSISNPNLFLDDEPSINLSLLSSNSEQLLDQLATTASTDVGHLLQHGEDDQEQPQLLDEEDIDLTAQFNSILTSLPLNFHLDNIVTIDGMSADPMVVDEDDELSEMILDSLLVQQQQQQRVLTGNMGSTLVAMPTQPVVLMKTDPIATPNFAGLVVITTNNRKPATKAKSSTTATTSQQQQPASSPTKSSKPSRPRGSAKARRSKIEKSERKKEQNKTAATRYREKKKLQAAIVNSEEQQLEQLNAVLITKKSQLSTEINIIKSCIRELIKAHNSKKVKK